MTSRGLPCGTRTIAEYCRRHADQRHLALHLYSPPSSWWPSVDLVARKVVNLTSLSASVVSVYLQTFYDDMIARNPTPSSDHVANRVWLITSVELIKSNAKVCHDEPDIQSIIGVLVKHLDKVPELSAYAEDFKRRCIKPPDVLELSVCSEDECPVCLEDFIPVVSAQCGHHVCSTCCRGMLATGRTLRCPLCRDTRFGALVLRLV